ncbi:MAG: hypothetical protein AAF515_16735 [Pseudomonadota bacterium]
MPVSADLRIDLGRRILGASTHITHWTNREKQFKYHCEIFEKWVEKSDNATDRAITYSCNELATAIYISPGEDMGDHSPEKLGVAIQERLQEYNVPSRVFIDPAHERGTWLAFYINGETWAGERLRPSQAIPKLKTVAAETNLILMEAGRIDAWMQ